MLRVGIADHFGWAIAVAADADGAVVDRRRIELVESGTTEAPVHYSRGELDNEALVAHIEQWRSSARRATAAAFDDLAATLREPVATIALRTWPENFPTDIDTIRRPPYEARVDAIMYRQVLADDARRRGWGVFLYDAKALDLDGSPKMGKPWTKDHRVALAAAVIAPAML